MDRPRPTNSSTWLPVSATECTDSASIDADPVSRKATNLITAMPRLAAKAATTALISRQLTRTRYSILVRRSRIATVWPGSIPDAMAR